MRSLTSLLAVLLMLVSAPAWAATYYVDRNLPGSDSNNGTSEDTPFLRISYAVTVATSPGDTILVKNGTYPETIWMKSSGTEGNPITLKNYPGHSPILDFGDGSNSNQRLFIKRTTTPAVIQYIVIEGLELTGGWEGIKGATAEFVTIRKNYIHNNGSGNGPEQSSGILCTYCYGWTIDRNIFYHNGDFTESRAYGVYIFGTGHVITNNLFYDNANSGLQGSGYAFSASGATAQRQAGFTATIANNTFAYNRSRAIVFDQAQHKDSIVQNNIMYQNATVTTVNGIRSAFGGGQGGHVFKYNHIYATAPRGVIPIDTENAASYTQTNNICLAVGVCGATATDPLMVNAPATVPASPDFALTSTSPLINVGFTVLSMPFNGSAPDMGAFETFGFSSALINENFMDVTLGMNLNTPVRPTAAGWSVACTGTDCGTPVVNQALLLTGTSSRVRLTITGIGGTGKCIVGQTWTVSYNSATGATTDSALIGNRLNQELTTFTTQAVTNSCGVAPPAPPAGVTIKYPLNENTGTVAGDTAVGDGAQNGTLTNTPSWVAPGKTGTSAVGFVDLGTQYIAVAYGSAVNPSSASFTDCLWVKPDAPGAARIFFGAANGTNQRYYLGLTGSSLSMGIQASPFSTNVDFPVTANYLRACVRMDSGTDTATLFMNGVKGTSAQSVKTYTSYTLASDLRLGLHETAGGIFSGGTTIDEYDHFPTALSDAGILLDFTSSEPPPPPAAGTLTQVTYRFYAAKTDFLGALIPLAANNTNITIAPGGAFSVVLQSDCTVANCASLAQQYRYSCASCPGSAGTYLAVPATATADKISFFGGLVETGLLSGTVTCCLSGALTPNNGGTQHTASAEPVYQLTQNASVVQRPMFKIDYGATPGWQYCFRAYDQSGNALNAYSQTACVTVVTPFAAGGGF